MGTVDRYLIQKDRMTWITNPADFPKISLEKKPGNAENRINRGLAGMVTEMILQPLPT